MIKYILVAIGAGIIAAFSQVLLKKSSNITYDSFIRQYLNFYVIAGYGLTFISMLLMIVAYSGMPFKYGAIIESLMYIYAMILGRFFFGEPITSKKVIGNLIIVAGVIVFML